MTYKLLESFRGLFDGQQYLHRRSHLGDHVAMHLYEDLYDLGRSGKFVSKADAGLSVLNASNKRQGIKARRGDGSYGESVPKAQLVKDVGFIVQRGPIANIEVGIEVKILMKAMIKQIDRVISDLRGQADHFRAKGSNAICVGIVGINRADYCVSYEGDRAFRTDGRKHKHPKDEADEAEKRLLALAAPAFDEFLIMRFEAHNEPPYDFKFSEPRKVALDYGAILARISHQYESRF